MPNGRDERLLFKEAALLLFVKAPLFKSKAKDGFARISAVNAASFIAELRALALFKAEVLEFFVAGVLVWLLRVVVGSCAPKRAKSAAELASRPAVLLDEIDEFRPAFAVDPAAPNKALYGFWYALGFRDSIIFC